MSSRGYEGITLIVRGWRRGLLALLLAPDAGGQDLEGESLDSLGKTIGGEGRNRAANALLTVETWLISLGISIKIS